MPATPIVYADRVKETSTTTGTGTFSLAGAATGYQTFAAGVGNGNRCIYCIELQSGSEWEVGLGTVTDASPDTLSRDEILYSSNSNSAVNFSSGTKNVFVTGSADEFVVRDSFLINGTGRFAQRGTQLGSSTTGTLGMSSPTISSVGSLTGIRVGQRIVHANFAAGTTVASIDSATQITASANSSGIAAGTTIIFGQPDDTYIADRWYALTQTEGIQYDRGTGDGDQHSIKLTQLQSTAQRIGLAQIVEQAWTLPLRSRRVRFQGRVKCSSSQAIRFAILEWTGTGDSPTSDVVNDWTNSTYTAGNFFLGSNLTVTAVGTITPSAATWTDFALKATLGASGRNIIVLVWTQGTAAQNVTLEISECSLTEGWIPLNWRPRNIADELHMCQRFYAKTMATDTAPVNSVTTSGGLYSSSTGTGAGDVGTRWPYPVAMRINPTIAMITPVIYTANSWWRGGIAVTASIYNQDAAAADFNNSGSTNDSEIHVLHATADAEL